MLTAEPPGQAPAGKPTFLRALVADPVALLPPAVTVALMLLWAVDDGGYDAHIWYWGAIVLLAVVAVTLIALGSRQRALSRPALVALTAFGGYVAWSYLSMAWAQTPGWALEGSNRALLYLLVFALFLIVPWTPQAALATLLAFVLGVGTIAIAMLVRLTSADHLQRLLIDGRLAAPTGYFNATVALFMMGALVATALAARRELPALLRGVLIAMASASLQLCVMGQSRGWLFTLPLVIVVALAVMPDRLRFAAAGVLPIVAVLIPVHELLHVFQGHAGSALDHAATSAGHTSLLICAGVFVLGAPIAWADQREKLPTLSRAWRRRLSVTVAVFALVATCGGALAATHSDPFGFIKRQWHGFSHPAAQTASSSHFTSVGSGRYDFWRVGLDAFASNPIGGLGQDNFADYYVKRRHTFEEPRWTHSLEIRLLVHTGIVGLGLFSAFLVAAIIAAFPALRGRERLRSALTATALLAPIVWLIHGSVDWFWEIPALSAPAFGFLGMAVALGSMEALAATDTGARRRVPVLVPIAGGVLAYLAAVVVLAFPYLSALETSSASGIATNNPIAALSRLATAADLNPLSPDPVRLAGSIALQRGQYMVAERRFRQTIAREPGGWFAWLGAGLAASALGNSAQAQRDFRTAASINSREPVIAQALASVNTLHPVTPAEALKALTTT